LDELNEYCAPGTQIAVEMIAVTPLVRLKVITFLPKEENRNPTVVFVPGWISLMWGWKRVLREMTRDFPIYYVETREKITSEIRGDVQYDVETIGQDIAAIVRHFNLDEREYVLFGSSLGATAILDCCRFLHKTPLALIVIGPNAVFRIPPLGLFVIRIFPPRLYFIIKPVVKWYLKTFRMDVDSDHKQYEKYCRALDTADPWKLKKGALALASYQIWDLLEDIEIPTLIIGASKDYLHEPDNLKKMVTMMPQATYLDMETNSQTHSEEMVDKMRAFIASLLEA